MKTTPTKTYDRRVHGLLLGLAALLCWASSVCAAERFSYNTDGSEVTDQITGLVWRRCAEGMVWSGSACTGSANTYSHEGALQRARTQSGWRLPNVKELSSLVDDTRISPAIDTVAFPNTPSTWFWTSSPHVGSPSGAWSILFNGGFVYNYSRSYNYYVRLVR